MQLQINNSKSIIKSKYILPAFLMGTLSSQLGAQEIIENEKKEEVAEVTQEPVQSKRIKIDGVAAVIGEYVILDSDVDVAYKQLVAEGVSKEEVDRCQLAGSLFESKLYAHHGCRGTCNGGSTA